MTGRTLPRKIIATFVVVSLLMMIGCTSLVPMIQEEESIVRAAEKLALSADFVVKTKNGEVHPFKEREASIVAAEGKRWIAGSGTRKIHMADVESILTDRDLLVTLGETTTIEFPAGRWKFLVNEGVLDSISGAGIKTEEMTDENRSGIFTAPLSDVTEMSVRETDTLATINLIAGIGLVVGLAILSGLISSLSDINVRI
jgi:hypothetical protein